MQLGNSQPSPQSPQTLAMPVPGARSALALLLFINLFNYIDRQILSAVLPRLQLDGTLFSPSDPLLQFKLGTLTSAFLFSYMLFSPIVGWLDGHGYRRWIILGFGVTIWSLASGASGFATSYLMLLFTRCIVGIGEGAYAPVASALLSDAYPPRHRGAVLAIFNMAIPVGSALGFVIGGLVSDYYDDWRHAFWFTFSGLFIGVFCFMRKELPRPEFKANRSTALSYWGVLKTLRTIRSFVFCCIGMTAITYVLGGVAAWGPTYIFQREARFNLSAETLELMENPPEELKRLPVPHEYIEQLRPKADGVERDLPTLKTHLGELIETDDGKLYFERLTTAATTKSSMSSGLIATIFGGIIVVGGLIATAFGAWLGERLRTKVRGAYFLVIGGGALLAFPAFVAFLYMPLPWGWVALFITVLGLFAHTGPGNTILANVVTTEMRATAFAINILVIHALGDVISPPIIGAVADFSSLQTSMLITSFFVVIGGVIWLFGARYLDDDTRRVS